MRRKLGADLKRRVHRLEIAARTSKALELWFLQEDGTLRCDSSDECLTSEAFDERYPPGSRGAIVLQAEDAYL